MGSDVQRLIPPHEKRILEAHVRGVPLSRLALEQRPLNEYESEQLKDLIKLRMSGLPLQYLTGTQAFYGREFYVNTGVLIPRPETEGLVELALKNLPPRSSDGDRQLVALDFGTGSGAIALTLALERRDLVVLAAECMEDARQVAAENARRHRVTNVRLLEVSEEPQLWQYDDIAPLDLLISNPPYLVLSDEIGEDVRNHEPPEALFTPDGDPMYFYRFLAELADAKLAPAGVGLFEIAEQRGEETAEVFRARGYATQVLKDLTERDRYILVRK